MPSINMHMLYYYRSHIGYICLRPIYICSPELHHGTYIYTHVVAIFFS